jgi:hypothetical protein
MPLIWQRVEGKWVTISTAGFPDEEKLHDLAEEAPQTLPLSGRPQLVVLGREVLLGSGYADLVAVEPTGRVVVIEIKLRRNSEARRAVVSQVLAYAANLRGMTVQDLDLTLRPHLSKRGHGSVADAVAAADQTGAFDRKTFLDAISASLREGSFRLVIVLDSAPSDLMRIAGYLEGITNKVLVDVITVSTFTSGDAMFMLPERVDPDRTLQDQASPTHGATKGTETEGAEVFEASIGSATPHEAERLRRLVAWARTVESEGLATLKTFTGVGRWTLLPRLQPENVGIVTIWHEKRAHIQLWKSVLQRRAPNLIEPIERKLGRALKAQTMITEFDEDLLALLLDAYRTAAGSGRVTKA